MSLWHYTQGWGFESQVTNEILVQVHLTVGSQTHHVVISLVLECIIVIDILSNRENHHICSLT